METIAGIRIPDSTLARDAEALVREHSPEFLLRHCQRTFVFGRLATDAAGLAVREELGYVAALLHDLGLTTRYTSAKERFEVVGADVARDWATSNSLSANDAQVIWDAIALHTSVGIADVRSPECALVHWGAGLDVAGFGIEAIGAAAAATVNAFLPRDGFAQAFAELIESTARRAPTAYAFTWLASTAQRFCDRRLPTCEDTLGIDPFA